MARQPYHARLTHVPIRRFDASLADKSYSDGLAAGVYSHLIAERTSVLQRWLVWKHLLGGARPGAAGGRARGAPRTCWNRPAPPTFRPLGKVPVREPRKPRRP